MKKQNDTSTQILLFELLFLIQEKMKEIVKNADADLSPLQILMLRTLVAEGEMTQNKLGKKIGRDKAQVTRLIQELVKKGLLIKTRSTTDKRSFIISTTASVKNKVESFINYEKELVKKMLKGCSDKDQQQFKIILSSMIGNIKE